MSKRSNKVVVWSVKAEIQGLGVGISPWCLYKGVAKLTLNNSSFVIYDHRPEAIKLMQSYLKALKDRQAAQEDYDEETWVDEHEYWSFGIRYPRTDYPQASGETIAALTNAQTAEEDALYELQYFYDKLCITTVSLRKIGNVHYLVIGLDENSMNLSTNQTEELTILENKRGYVDKHLLRKHYGGIELINLFETVNISGSLTVQGKSQHYDHF